MTRGCAHNSNRIEQTLLCEAILQTPLVAPLLAIIAVAHRAPRRTDARAATREEEVVVQLVFRLRRPPTANWPHDGGALDGNEDGGVVGGGEDVTSETVRIGFPAEWVALSGQHE